MLWAANNVILTLMILAFSALILIKQILLMASAFANIGPIKSLIPMDFVSIAMLLDVLLVWLDLKSHVAIAWTLKPF